MYAIIVRVSTAYGKERDEELTRLRSNTPTSSKDTVELRTELISVGFYSTYPRCTSHSLQVQKILTDTTAELETKTAELEMERSNVTSLKVAYHSLLGSVVMPTLTRRSNFLQPMIRAVLLRTPTSWIRKSGSFSRRFSATDRFASVTYSFAKISIMKGKMEKTTKEKDHFIEQYKKV